MKCTKLWGMQVIDRDSGRSLGRIAEILTLRGEGADALVLLAQGEACILYAQQIQITPNTAFARKADASRCSDMYPLPRGVPVLDAAGSVAGSITDYELDGQGQCVEIITEAGNFAANEATIGPHAVIAGAAGDAKASAKDAQPQPQANTQEPSGGVTLSPKGQIAAGAELLGRVATKDILNPAGTVMLPKGGRVSTDVLQQSIAQGWLVALATGTARSG